MDSLGLLFILLFCILGALIAWGADSLGRNIGKKRRSLLGLRPRHTAALLTAIAGFMLPLITALLLFALSKDVRTWIIEGRHAVEERDRKVSELRTAENSLVEAIKSRNSAQSDLEDQKGQLQNLTRQRSDALAELVKTKAEAKKLGASVSDLRQKQAQAQARERTAKNNLSKATSNLAKVQQQYDKTDKEYRQAELDKQIALKQYNDANKETARITFDLTNKEKELAGLQKRIDNLGEQYEALKAQKDEEIKLKNQEIQNVNNELESGRLRLDQAKADLARSIELSKQNLNENLRITRTLGLTFSSNDELARLPVATGLTPAQAEAALSASLRSARSLAAERGAKAATDSGPVAGLIDLKMDTNQMLTAIDQQVGAVSAITNSNEPKVILINSLWNTFVGEFIPVRVKVVPNPIAFQQSENVAEMIFDGTQSEEFIVEQITHFLITEVREAALARKMIPATGHDASFGSLPTGQLLDLVRDIRATRRQVRVVAQAAAVTRVADPIRLEFRLR